MKKISLLLILVSILGFGSLNCMKKRFSGFKRPSLSGIKKSFKRPTFLGGKQKPAATTPWSNTSSTIKGILNKPKTSSAPFWKKGTKWGTVEKVDTDIVKQQQQQLITGKRIPGLTAPTDTQIAQMATAKPTPFRKDIMKPVSKMSKEKIEKLKKIENLGTVTEEDIAWKGISKPGARQKTLQEQGFRKPTISSPALTTTQPSSRWKQFRTQAPSTVKKGFGTLASPFKTAGRKIGGIRKNPVVRSIANGFKPRAFWKKKTPTVQQVTPFRQVKPSPQIQAAIGRATQPQTTLLKPSATPVGQTPAWQTGTIKPQVRPRSGALTSAPAKPTASLPVPNFGPPPALPTTSLPVPVGMELPPTPPQQ